MGDYNIKPIYQGGTSSFSQSYGDVFTGYHIGSGEFGLTTNPQMMDQIKDISTKLASGAKNIEMSMVTPDIFDNVSKQQLKEINRLSKLTGANISVHGAVMDSAGLSREGFSEADREFKERKIAQQIQRSHELDPKGNIPVVFHSAEAITGTEWETLGKDRKARKIIAVDRESGQMIPLEGETLYYPSMEKYKQGAEQKIQQAYEKYQENKISQQDFQNVQKKYIENVPVEKGKYNSPEDRLRIANDTKWDNELNQLFFNKERADEILQKNQIQIAQFLEADAKGLINRNNLTPTQQQAFNHLESAQNYLKDTRQSVEALFHKAYKYGDSQEQKLLSNFSEKFKQDLEKSSSQVGQSQALQNLINNLKKVTPETYVPVEQFATEKSSKTFGNAAFTSYQKFGDNSPVVCIENPPVGFALSTGQDLKNLVDKSREQFVKRAINEGISKSEAEFQAEKLIGATWDVGHINMLRKQGFGDKEIIKETEIVAPVVKHIHVNDNFGIEHTELPMGMGNVPMKEMMEKLGKQGVKARKIIEAGQWWQQMKTPPITETLQAMGSPVYSDGVGPLWNQSIGLQQGYFSGYGSMLPQINYQSFGSGFSQLPGELGGQIGSGQGSRMSGRGID